MYDLLFAGLSKAMLAARRGTWIKDDASLNLTVGSSLLRITLSKRSFLNF